MGKRVRSPEQFLDTSPQDLGVLFDERKIGRAEAIQRFFTIEPGCERKKLAPERLFKQGQSEFALLRPTSSFVAPQIRDQYDPYRIVRTGRSIVDSQDGQLQNCGVAFIDVDQIDKYIADLNQYFETNITVDDLSFHDKFGCYVITVFGHNRQFGIAAANKQDSGNPDSGAVMWAKVFRNPSFWRVIEAQAVENTGEAPSMWDRARSIVYYKKFRNRDGVPPSQEEVASKFNVTTDQIWRAERYDALPQEIKNLVMSEKLVYSGAFELDALIPFYGDDYVIELANKLANRRASGPQIIEEVKKRIAAVKLTSRARALIDEGVLTLPQAQELANLADIASGQEQDEVLAWIAFNRPDIETIKKRIKGLIEAKLSGKMSFFDEQLDEEQLEAMQRMNEQLRRSESKAMIQATMSEITRLLSGLMGAHSVGLVGDLADTKVSTSLAPEALHQILLKLSEPDNLSLESISQLIGLRSTTGIDREIGELLDKVVAQLTQMSAETAQTQAERLARIQALDLPKLAVEEYSQEGLF